MSYSKKDNHSNNLRCYLNKKIPRKVYITKTSKIFIYGKIYENHNKIIKSFLNPMSLAGLNGEFFFIIQNLKKKKIILGNSNTSIFQLFFRFDNKLKINLSNDIFRLIDKKTKIQNNKISEWLYTNGRNLDEKTFFSNINSIHPGSVVNFNLNNYKIKENTPFFFSNKKNKVSKSQDEDFFIGKITSSLVNALKVRIENKNHKITMGLSGGYDSRIILHLLKENFKNKVFTHTHGDKFSLEKKASRAVSRLLKVSHEDIIIKPEDYYLAAENILDYGNYNVIFKTGVKQKIYKKIFKKNKSKYFIQGNALDVLIGSSFSKKRLTKIKSKKNYINWFLESIKLFEIREIENLLNINLQKMNFKKNINEKVENRVNKINYNDDYINLNDALTFDLRIKRWHNSQLAVFLGTVNKIIPTYDKFFLKVCSELPSYFRLNDKFRKKLLKKLNPKLYALKTPELLLNKNLKKKSYHIFDSDIAKDMKKNKNFKKFIQTMMNKNQKDLSLFFDIQIIKKIIKNYNDGIEKNSRKIFMLITLIMTINKFIDIKKNA